MTPGEQSLAELAKRLAWTEWRLQQAEWRLFCAEGMIERLEQRAGLEAIAAEAHTKRWQAKRAPPQSAPAPAPAPATADAPPAPPTAAPVPSPESPPAEPKAPFDWESIIGVRLFAWLGGAALFVAAALFLNYSIQQNLVSPPVRVALGLLVGAAALLGGDRLREKADRAGQALCGAGVATLYAALFAGHSLYHLVPSAVAFLGMALVTTTAGALAVRRDALLVAVLGLVGGFLTPYLVSTGEDRPLSLFAYIALLDAGVVAVASRRRWPVLPLLGVAGSSLVYLGWSLKFLDASRAPYALVAAAALAAVFAFTTPQTSRTAESTPRVLGRATASVAAVLPLVLALVVSGESALPVAPVALVAYLAVLSAGAWFVGRRVDLPALAPIAAACGAVTLAVRVDAGLFPAARLTTLAVFAVLPVAWFALWLARRTAPGEKMLRVAATIAIAASAVLVVAHVCAIEDGRPAIAPLAIYAWLHAALLGAVAVLAESSAFFVLALAVEITALTALAIGSTTDRLGEYLPVVFFPMLAFWSLPLLGPAFRRGFGVWVASTVGLAIHFLFLYALAERSWGDGPLGACAVACGLFALGTLWVARTRATDPRVGVYALVGGIALSFFTAAVPILLSNEWLTIAWALEAAALAWLVRRVKHKGLLVAAALLGAATLLRLLVNPAVLEYHARSSTPILNWWLYTYGVAAAAFLAAWHLLREDATAARARLPEAFAFAGGLLLFVLVNIEIADFYSTGSELTFHFSGGGFGQDMTYTLAWGVFALALLGLGVMMRSRPSRICAIVLVCMTAAKGALHDVWALGSLYRVGAIVGLAVTLLGVSYLTQRFVLRKTEAA